MDSLSLNNSPIEISKTDSDRLFFDHYQYSCRFHMQKLFVIRGLLNHTDKSLNDYVHKRYTRHHHVQQSFNRAWSYPGLKQDAPQPRELYELRNLIDLSQFVENNKDFIKLTINYGGWGHLYVNDLNHINQLFSINGVTYDKITQVVINRPRDTVLLKHSKYQLRTYFRDLHLTSQQQGQLKHFLQSQEDFRLSPGLADFVDNYYLYTYRYHFIDHNRDSDLLMLEMIVPGIIRKTLKIIEVNN